METRSSQEGARSIRASFIEGVHERLRSAAEYTKNIARIDDIGGALTLFVVGGAVTFLVTGFAAPRSLRPLVLVPICGVTNC